MKRLFLLIALVIVVSCVLGAHRREHVRSTHRSGSIDAREAEVNCRLLARIRQQVRQALDEARDDVHEALSEARDEVHQALDEARNDVHQALNEASDDVHEALGEAHAVLVSDDDTSEIFSQTPAAEREDAEGLPVPIVPGTRVTEAHARPPAPAAPARPPVPPAPPAPPRPADARKHPAPGAIAISAPDPSPLRKVAGRISATKERAEADARRELRDEIVRWIDPDVPHGWTPPERLLEAMVRGTRFEPVVKDYGTLYVAELTIEASPARRAALVAAYNHELVQRRLVNLGGALAFVLACLAVVSGYIRTDEVTKGYYTNRLRLLAAAGVGAAGVVIYRMVS